MSEVAEKTPPKAAVAMPAPDFASDPKGYEAYVRALRAKRQPFGNFQQKLAYPPREGYYRYWFNDEPGRVLEATDSGYQHVKDQLTGEHVKRVVGTRKEGGALWAFLMEIPTVLWEEDRALQNQRTDAIEAAIKRSKVISQTDESAKEDEGGFYVPRGGSSVRQGVGRRGQTHQTKVQD